MLHNVNMVINNIEPKQGNGRIIFEDTIPVPVSESQAMEYQLRKGYHPNGYGFYGFKCQPLLDKIGFYRVFWWCGDSSD
jgi:hypothetical protein